MRQGLCKSLVIACMVCALGLPGLVEASSLPYQLANWPESGFGNHRVRIEVSPENRGVEAVEVSIPWRRRDDDAASKAVLLYDEQGRPVRDIVTVSLTPEQGRFIFRPHADAGVYYLYYLPYELKGMFEGEKYMAPQQTADAQWAGRVRGKRWPEAQAVAMEARQPQASQSPADFHSFYPMEVVATQAETLQLAQRHNDKPFLVFPEDRKYAIRMNDKLPLRWIERGPVNAFVGEAKPGEYYAFQLGVWAHRQALEQVDVVLADLRGQGDGVISKSAMICFNTHGVDFLGRPMVKRVDVSQGHVQALWLGVQIPEDARGRYETDLAVRDAQGREQIVKVMMDVAGDVLADGGVSDAHRLSRLKWLNSTRGLDDDIVLSAFDPVSRQGNRLSIRHRDITLADTGLPASITSQGVEILASPVRIHARSQGQNLTLQGSGQPAQVVAQKQAKLTLSHAATLGDHIASQVRTVTESDGSIQFWVDLTADQNMALDQLMLTLPVRKEVAKYWMGMEKRGGFRQGQLDWTWNNRYVNNLIWVGDVKAGVQLKLQSTDDTWALWALPLDSTMLWSQDGRGGCRSIETEDSFALEAYTGRVRLEAGKTQTLRFRLLVTPFKTIDVNHWDYRIQDAVASPDNKIFHLHHGSAYLPYINYPFTNMDGLKQFVSELGQERQAIVSRSTLDMPLTEGFNAQQGAIHLDVTGNFDSRQRVAASDDWNMRLMTLELGPKVGRLGFYWNTDDSGMRVYFQQGATDSSQYPVMIYGTQAEYRPGDRHRFTIRWGSKVEVFMDGQALGSVDYTLPAPSQQPVLRLEGEGFTVAALRVDAQSSNPETGEITDKPGRVLFQRFTKAFDPKSPGMTLAGSYEVSDRGLTLKTHKQHVSGREVQVYYTVRELSNHAPEIWPFRSLGDEIYTQQGGLTYAEMGAFSFGSGGGYPWLQEHLGDGYVPGWRTTWLPEAGLPGDFCAAITTNSDSRLINYYVESLDWLFRELGGAQGLYLDGIGYNREVTKRAARTLGTIRPDYRINAHLSDLYELDRISALNQVMEHLPYMTDLWIGEMYNYRKSPDYWLIEISGIPFGLTNEMLNYENGGNAYRGMIFGMSGRFLPDVGDMWRVWDEFDIKTSRMVGFWEDQPVVKPSHDDIKATAYVKDGEALIALAQWSQGVGQSEKTVHVPIDRRGRLDQPAQLGRFINYTTGGLMNPELQTVVHTTITPGGLKFEFTCYQTQAIQAKERPRDGAVWEDDAIEFFIQPDSATKSYFQFIVNAAGSIYDSHRRDAKWNGKWESSVRTIQGGWAGTVVIPWSTLGMKAMPQSGDALAFNICRDHGKQSSCWSLPDGSFHNTRAFVRMQATEKASDVTRELLPDPSETRPMVSTRLQISPTIFTGFDPSQYELYAPAIKSFQNERTFQLDEAIPVELNKGWLLWLRKK